MLHACNAVDGTARARRGARDNRANAERFKGIIREEIDILEIIGMPGIDLRASRFPYSAVVSASRPQPDIADVLYHVHRCAHGHGDDVTAGFDLEQSNHAPGNHTMHFDSDAVRLPASSVLGLVAIAVLAPENGSERAWDAAIPWQGGELVINDWWGRGADFRTTVERSGLNRYKLDFTPPADTNAPLGEIIDEVLRRSLPPP